MSSTLEVVMVVCLRTWKKTFRRPVVLSFSFLQPLMWMLFFGFLFERYAVEDLKGSGHDGADLSYLDYLAPGVCAMTVLFGASQSGIGWIRDINTGFLPRMLRSPSHLTPILLGKVVADVVRLSVQAGIVLILAVFLGARLRFSPFDLLIGFVALSLFAAGFSCLSCAIALRTRAQEAMAVFVHVVNMPILFTSTALVPGKQMPEWLASIARWNPLSQAVDPLRSALLFGEIHSAGVALGFLLVVAIALFSIALLTMAGVRRR